MSINIFGSSSNKSNTTKNYVDSKFISLIKNINTKMDKSGGTLSGILDMTDHKITNLANPDSNNDACNKKYVNSKFASLSENLQLKADKQYVDEIIIQTIDNVVKHVSSVVEKTINNLDVASKTYVDDSIEEKFEEWKAERRQKKQNENLRKRAKSD